MNEVDFLKSYDPNIYAKPSITTDVVIFSLLKEESGSKRLNDELKLQVLLVKRKEHPYKDSWALPGGFLDMRESLLDCAYRELNEETGVSSVYLEQLYTWGDIVDRDPRDRVVSSSYMALTNSESHLVVAGDDASEAVWFTVTRSKSLQDTDNPHQKLQITELTFESEVDKFTVTSTKRIYRQSTVQSVRYEMPKDRVLAFDHVNIISYAFERLEAKIMYTPIAFNLIPEEFTLYELQRVYELILNKHLLTPNFRSKIKGMVEETGSHTEGKQSRPAKLYRYKETWESWD